MPRKKNTDKQTNLKYRFMCMRSKSTNYSIEFDSKDEALNYTSNLDDSKIEWYAVYELDEVNNTLRRIISKRLLQHDNVPKLTKEELTKVKTTRQRRKSK